jgi:surface polysaccharide O-acyltransferase-like enzyme
VTNSIHTPAGPRGRIIAYDALRVFAICSVVAIHTLMPYRASLPADAFVRVFDDLLHYAVPLFVFISGALIWARPWNGGPGAYRTFLRRRFSVIALPYAVWAAIYSAIFIGQAADRGHALRQLPGLVLTGHVWYHLYFIPMLLTFYLLTPLASKLAHRNPELLVVVAYLVRLLAGPAITEAARALFGVMGWQYATHVVIHLPHMALGAWFALRMGVLPRWFRAAWLPLLVGGLAINTGVSLSVLSAIAQPWRNSVIALGMALLVLGIALKVTSLEPLYEHWAPDITRAGSLAFGVYFVHPLLLLGLNGALSALGAQTIWLSQPWFPVVVWAVVSGLSFWIAEVLSQSRSTSWLVGLARQDSR